MKYQNLQNMHYWLQHAEMASAKIEVVELARKQVNMQPISASRVCQLWQEQAWHALEASKHLDLFESEACEIKHWKKVILVVIIAR